MGFGRGARRRPVVALLLGILAGGILAGGISACGTAWADPTRFTILYAHSTTELEDVQGRGGIARLATLVRQERAAGGTVLVLHGGQALAPSVLSFYDQGAHVIDLLNGVGIDAMAALNREFHHGDDVLMTRAFEASFPMVVSNAVDRQTGKPLDGLEDRAMLNAGPVRVGVLAATPARTGEITRSPRTDFLPPGPVLARKAKDLRNAGADLVVALTGDSGGTHREVIASGAADIVLYQDRGRVVAVDYDGKTLNATVEPQAAWVLALDVTAETVTKGGATRTVWSSGVRAIDTATVPPDPALDAQAKAYRARLDSMLGMQVGRLDTAIDTRREAVRASENAFANTVADSLREAMEADVALINGGSFRGDRAYAAGTVWTRRDIQTEFPFHDTAVLIEVTGQQLREALEFGVSGIEQLQGRFPHLSNARVTVDASRPPGQRVVALTVGGKPVEPMARFRLATGSYLANGGDGYAMLSTAPRLVDDRDADFVSTILASRIARTGSFAPRLDGRLTVQR